MLNIASIFRFLQGFPCFVTKCSTRVLWKSCFLHAYGYYWYNAALSTLKVLKWCHCLVGLFAFCRHEKSSFFWTGTQGGALERALKDTVFCNSYGICCMSVWPHRNKNTHLSLCQCLDIGSIFSSSEIPFLSFGWKWWQQNLVIAV